MKSPVATCPAGTVQGIATDGVQRFAGIPYARPPVGPLRFAACQPLDGWTGTLDASRFGPASAQVFDPQEGSFEDFGETDAEPGRRWVGSEDSLTLNIWRPERANGPLPVVIWIHGGANWLGASRVGFYDGTALARQGVIFVSMNYRLGVFGFLDLSPIGGPDQAHSNGLTDQLAAIDWVVANIASFGGDASNITLMGNSAGSIDISWHIASGRLPKAIRRVVMSSGVGSASGLGWDGTASAHAPEEGRRRAAALLAELGFTTFADLQAASTREILTRHAETFGPGAGLPDMDTLFYPRTGDYAALDPFAAAAHGAGRDLQVMIGFTAYEMGLWLSWDDAFDQRPPEWAAGHAPFVPKAAQSALPDLYRQWLPEATDGQLSMHIVGDVVFALPSLWYADLMTAAGATVHAYRFDWQVDDRLGALHAADIAFFLGVQDSPAAEWLIGTAGEPGRSTLGRTMTGAVATFAATGIPVVDGTPWPVYGLDRHMMLFNTACRVVADPIRDRRVWWTDTVLPPDLQIGAVP
jgi:para-nitrobenzyl esterase